jgi:hypothetical protein
VRWLDAINVRPPVVRGMAVKTDVPPTPMDDEARKHLYGQR